MSKKSISWGAGLLALDVIVNGSPSTPPKLSAGGSCGNVMAILSYLNWSSYPIARLANNKATSELIEDLQRWGVKTDYIQKDDSGSTAIIIHRILVNKKGKPTHRFEFKNPNTGNWLPGYKPVLSKQVPAIIEQLPNPSVFYFDRASRSTIDLAKEARKRGGVVFFESSSIGDGRLFEECLSASHIFKFSNDRISDYKIKYKKARVNLEIETLGKDGLNFRYPKSGTSKWRKIEPFLISELIDSAGAGDWCTAGIINGLCKGGFSEFKQKKTSEIVTSLHDGQKLGAMNCFFDGARGVMYNVEKAKFNKLKAVNSENTKILDKTKITSKIEPIHKVHSPEHIDQFIFLEC